SPGAKTQEQSGFFGTPLQGSTIEGCGGGIVCGTDVRACDSVCFCRMKRSSGAPAPGFGVVGSLQDQVSSMFAGDEEVNVLLDTQLFTDCCAPKRPPTSVMSAECGSGGVPLFVNLLPKILFPESWKYTVDGVGGDGSGFSEPSRPVGGVFW